MTITLTAEQEKLVSERIGRGYLSAEHVAAEAFRLLAVKEERERTLAELRNDIDAGWNEAEKGETVDGSSAMAALVARATARIRE
jgi:hypothetical protein